MIIVITPNPAIDITYEVAHPRLNQVNRVTGVVRRPGGKGLNVASVLRQTREADGAPGRRVRISGFLGGRQGEEMRELLGDWDAEQAWLDLGPGCPTRATVIVRDADGGATGLYEPGAPVSPADWRALTDTALEGAGRGDVLVVSGSCPPETSAEDLGALLRAARGRGARVILDTSGPLLVACAGLADAVKPNREELAQATGETSPAAGAVILLERGVRAVMVSDGPRGMSLYVRGQDGPTVWHADAPDVPVVNPTGAGDSAVAAIAAFMDARPEADPIDARALGAAVALSVAAVRTPVAGLVDLETYTTLLPTMKVETHHVTD